MSPFGSFGGAKKSAPDNAHKDQLHTASKKGFDPLKPSDLFPKSEDTKPKATFASGSSEKKKKEDSSKKEVNQVINIRKAIVKKMQALNQEAATSKEPAAFIQNIVSTVLGWKKDLESLETAANALGNNPSRDFLRKQHANKSVYAAFSTHLLTAAPEILLEQ